MTTESPPAADPLYELPPADFVAARNALAKELRAGGDRVQAALVAKLRRPTPLAYALNLVARRDAAVLEGALAAGAALRAATDAAVAGDAAELRPATASDRNATRALTEALAAVLGTSAADLAPRVTATVRAAVSTPPVAEEVRAGRLAEEPGSSGSGLGTGFGFGDGTDRDGDTGATVDPGAAAPPDDLAPRRQAKQAKVDQAAREQAQREAEERRARQRQEAEHRRRIDQLESRARRLGEKADAAEQAAAEARADATAAEDALARAREEGP